MPHYFSYSLRDYGGETSHVTINVAAITIGTLAGLVTAVGAIRTAIENVTLGVVAKEKIVMDDTFLSGAKATDKTAQRELKWLVEYEGVTSHKSYSFEIPTADPELLLDGAEDDSADLTLGGFPALIAALENASIGRVPGSDTEAINVTGVKLVGRNL